MEMLSRRSMMGVTAASVLAGFRSTSVAQASEFSAIAYLRTNWSRDPFSYGAYSYLPKSVSQSTRNALEAPVGKHIFFAGEATHPVRNSTVHAAYESGIRAATAISRTDAKRIAIVGAGVSGLAAAHQLSRSDLEVTLFEARDRIGGRIWTDRSLGIPLDLGASWIHGVHDNPLTRIADDLNITRTETAFDYILRGKDGREISESRFPDWLSDVAEIQQNAGADADQLNLDDYAAQEDYEGPDVIFPAGYDQILSAFAGPYTVRLSTPVQQITHAANGVTLWTKTGDADFDATLVTLPLGVLKAGSVRFTPELPTEKQDAIARLGMGLLDKLYLQFATPFWDTDKTWILTSETRLPRGQFNQWLNLFPILNVPVLIGFNGGSAALKLAEYSDEELLERASKALSSAYPR